VNSPLNKGLCLPRVAFAPWYHFGECSCHNTLLTTSTRTRSIRERRIQRLHICTSLLRRYTPPHHWACSYLAASCSNCPLTSLNLSPTPGFLYHAGSFTLHPRKGCAITTTQVGQTQQDPHCTSLPPGLFLRGPRSKGNEQIARVARHGHLQAS
jgi:hypothetical protein